MSFMLLGTRIRVAAVCLASLITWAPSQASPSASKASAPTYPIALSMSGGVSLGAYQAGQIYYSSQFFQANGVRMRLMVTTGSSAGSLNTLLNAIQFCQGRDEPPDESLWWRVWSTPGFRQLRRPTASPRALLSDSILLDVADSIIAKRWNEGFPEDCDQILGVTTTLVTPETLPVSGRLFAQRQELRFAVRVRGRGVGRPPLVENHVTPVGWLSQPMLYLDPDPDKRFAQMRDVVLASIAFPGGFPPRKLRFCRNTSESDCSFARSEEADFVDGGLFENQPLHLALKMAAESVVVDARGRASLRDAPLPRNHNVPKGLLLRHLDVDSRGYPEEDPDESTDADAAYIPYILKLVGHFVGTARSRELYSVLEDHPEIRPQILTSVSLYPKMGDPWGGFFGFLDVGFREYDFLLGMVEAKKSLDEALSSGRIPGLDPNTLLFPRDNPRGRWTGPIDRGGGPTWRKFMCLDAFLSPRAAPPLECASPEFANLRVLTQLALVRLTQACTRDARIDELIVKHPECLSLRRAREPRWVDRALAEVPWTREEGEDLAAFSFRYLSAAGYAFEPEEFEEGGASPERQVREKLQRLFYELADRQPAADSFRLRLLADQGLNLYRYLPPESVLHAGFGTNWEVGISSSRVFRRPLPEWFKMQAALQIHRPQDAFKGSAGDSSWKPLVGVEMEPPFASGSFLQSHLGLRTGYLVNSETKSDRPSCDRADGTHKESVCSGWLAQALVGFSIQNRIRLQVTPQVIWPDDEASEPQFITLGQFGVQFPL